MTHEFRPLSPGEQPGEFDIARGEVQRPGSHRPMGNQPPVPPNIPIGIAPPDPTVVVSNFDTRPVGAYDFAASAFVEAGPGEVIQTVQVEFAVPDGYTAVLRRVLIDCQPGAVATFNPAAATVFNLRLLRNAAPIPNNTVQLKELLHYEWPTHQVYGMTETMGLVFNPTGWAVPVDPEIVNIGVTFMGVLIPTKGRPPEVEIASPPVLVRVYTPPEVTR
jgi:hypothetical protein